MKRILRAVYVRLGRPAPARVGTVCGAALAAAVLAAAVFGPPRLVAVAVAVSSLTALAGVALAWSEAHRARAEARRSAERTEVTYRRILAAFEAERLAADRRRSAGEGA